MNKWLFLTLVTGAFLRLCLLQGVPPSPSLDEVSIGYNAYSILATGKDEYGMRFPLLLRAYDDFRPALYVYFVIPFVRFLGLSTLAVRLPSVVLSILTIFVTYLLGKKLFKNETHALLTSFLLAISPWHVYLSRLGHEVNLGLFAGVVASYFFLHYRLFLSSIFFALALYSYQSQKVIVPIVLLGLILFFKKRAVLVAVIVGVLAIPLIRASFTQGALIRFQATSAFAIDQPFVWNSREAFAKAKGEGDIIGQLVHHRFVVYAKIFWTNYISHLGPKWLFFGSDRESHKVPNMGLLYWWELPLVLVGFVMLFRLKDKQAKRLIFLWLLASPIPAAITTQAPHAMRFYTAVPYFQMISAMGLSMIWQRQKALTVIVLTLSTLFFVRQYFVLFPRQQSDSFQYALSQSIASVLLNKNEYGKIVFSNREHLSQSYMFFLFWSRYDPAVYLAQGGTKTGGFEKPHAFDRFEFRPIDWRSDRNLTKTLFLGNMHEFFSVEPMKEFQYLDGKVGVVAIGT